MVGEDGRRHLFVSGIRRIGLADDGLSTVGELEQVYDGWRYPDDWITEAYALEGPKLFRRDDWFYLVSAIGGTAGPPTGHMVIVARSHSVLGPWEDCPHNPVVRTQGRRPGERWWSRGTPRSSQGPARMPGGWSRTDMSTASAPSAGRSCSSRSAWTDDGWPAAAAVDIGSPHGPSPADAVTAARAQGVRRRLASVTPRRAMDLPRADRRGSRVDSASDDGLGHVWGRGAALPTRHRSAIPTGDHAYEVEVDVEVSLDSGAVEGGLLLFFNNRLFCGMGDRRTCGC